MIQTVLLIVGTAIVVVIIMTCASKKECGCGATYRGFKCPFCSSNDDDKDDNTPDTTPDVTPPKPSGLASWAARQGLDDYFPT